METPEEQIQAVQDTGQVEQPRGRFLGEVIVAEEKQGIVRPGQRIKRGKNDV
jgi:hypothetical protein